MKIHPFLCAFIFVSSSIYSACSIDQLFYHQGKITDNLCFYFSTDPLVNNLGDREGTGAHGWKTVRMLLAKTSASAKIFTSAQQIKSPHYRVTMAPVVKGKGPIDGILLTVSYDPLHIALKLSRGPAIKQQPSFGIQFYHRATLQELVRKSQAVQRIASHKPVIVIDKGHGGDDHGKVGCFNIKEKKVTAQVGIKVAKLLNQRGYKVLTTRIGDETVPLDVRTTFANTVAQADLFISLHANSAPSAAAQGVETFCLSPARTHADQLIGTFDQWKHSQSCTLARHIHTHVVATARETHPHVADRNVKTAVSQVLLGTDMPAALIELGFLSNEDDAKRLASNSHQEHLARAICNGIEAFIAAR